MKERTYIAIDLKSFYASVECVERDLDPLEVNLVVADVTRTEKTICLAVSPALKSYGIPGRARLFEVVQKVAEVNEARRYRSPGGRFQGSSSDQRELRKHPELALDYVTAPPRMALYMEYSRRIYAIYLKYIAPEDIHVYSIDEVFLDVTSYLKTYGLTSEELARKMIREVLHETGITATAGIGTNLYLAKIAMDIMAKHVEPDEDGVRIAKLNERSYREQLWNHRPLTDFWRVGRGYAVFAVGEWMNGDPFELALALVHYGFRVSEIYGTLSGENFVYVKQLAKISPDTKVFSNLEPTMLYYDKSQSGVNMTIGKDAGYYHKECSNVLWNEERQPYGYAGVRRLFEALAEV